jgi:hypothetical protein
MVSGNSAASSRGRSWSPASRVVLPERLVRRQHLALLGVEQEHEPEDHGEQRAIHLVWPLREHLAQQRSARRVVRGLETAQQLVERVEHLPGEALADLVLESAAVLEERGEALRARERQEPPLAQEQAQRGRDRPARRLHHVGDAEVEPTRAFRRAAPTRGAARRR